LENRVPRKKNKKKRLVTIGAVALVALILFSLVGLRIGKQQFIMPFKFIFMEASASVQGVLVQPYIWFKQLVLFGGSCQDVKVQNQALLKENARLRQELVRYQEAYLAKERYRKLLQLKKQFDYPVVFAQVIGVDLAPWAGTILVDRGLKDGVMPDMVAMTWQGVIGHTIEAFPSSSRVLLLSDPRSRVAAIVQRTRVRGVLKGTGSSFCSLDYVEKGTDVDVGDKIISAGTDGIFPKGLLLGVVSSVDPGAVDRIFQTITVEPSAELNNIEEVSILLTSTKLDE